MFLRSLALALPAFVISTAVSADVVDNNLLTRMQEVGPEGTVSALVYMNDQLDTQDLSDAISAQRLGRAHRHQIVVEALQDVANNSQGPILAAIETSRQQGLVEEVRLVALLLIALVSLKLIQLNMSFTLRGLFLKAGLEK